MAMVLSLYADDLAGDRVAEILDDDPVEAINGLLDLCEQESTLIGTIEGLLYDAADLPELAALEGGVVHDTPYEIPVTLLGIPSLNHVPAPVVAALAAGLDEVDPDDRPAPLRDTITDLRQWLAWAAAEGHGLFVFGQ